MARRPSNADLMKALREKLTSGFYVEGLDEKTALAATKAWRQELWKMVGPLSPIQERMCPVDFRDSYQLKTGELPPWGD